MEDESAKVEDPLVAALRDALVEQQQSSESEPPPLPPSASSVSPEAAGAAAGAVAARMALVRAPGRVNLIGEHVDYHGYGVLPLALEKHVAIVVGKPSGGSRTSSGPGHVVVRNLDQEYYPGTHLLPLDDPLGATKPPDRQLHWSDYVGCALHGVLAHQHAGQPAQALDGLVLIVHGTLPPAAGLSSSSALVVASAMAFLWALGVSLPDSELATLCIDCERLIGTAGGGMDQTASIMARPGDGIHIRFSPELIITYTSLPENGVFVVANSMRTAEKAMAAHSHYNLRVVEGRLAVALLGKALRVQEWASLRTLWELEAALIETTFFLEGAHIHPTPNPGVLTADMLRTALKPGAYTLQELQSALGTTDIVDTFLPDCREAAALVFAHNSEFKLLDRALHVIEEVERVRAFVGICLRECGHGDRPDPEDVLDRLGALMNASHESCRYLYECSHWSVDRLVEACRRAGAKGSRLTGAGWGGCCVSLVHKDDVPAFMDRVWQDHFKGDDFMRCWEEKDRCIYAKDRALFATRPGPGASVVELGLG